MKTLFHTLFFLSIIGFMAACSSAPEGEKVKTEDTKKIDEEVKETAAMLSVSVEKSTINWVGTKTGGQHEGTIGIKSGSLNVKGEEIVGGEFTIDMNSIAVTDLAEDQGKAKLEGHLKDGDFFEVEKFPEAKFVISKVTAEAGENGATHKIEGNLTMKGIEKGVTLPAMVKFENGAVMASTPQFTINRQEWGINYQNAVKEVVLNDEMGIKISLTANTTEG